MNTASQNIRWAITLLTFFYQNELRKGRDYSVSTSYSEEELRVLTTALEDAYMREIEAEAEDDKHHLAALNAMREQTQILRDIYSASSYIATSMDALKSLLQNKFQSK